MPGVFRLPPELFELLEDGDVVVLTADHGCDDLGWYRPPAMRPGTVLRQAGQAGSVGRRRDLPPTSARRHRGLPRPAQSCNTVPGFTAATMVTPGRFACLQGLPQPHPVSL